MSSNPPFRLRGPSGAFTLIEILVVVSIISILAALSVGVFRSAFDRAKATESMNSLRQVGNAILLYSSDNETELPGPLYTSVVSRFRTSDSNQLATRIAPYLGYTVTNQWQGMKELIPSNRKISAAEAANSSVLTFNTNVNDYVVDDVPRRPFGYPGSASYSAQPLRLVQITNPNSLWLLNEKPFGQVKGKDNYVAGIDKRMFLFASGRVSFEAPDFSARAK